MKSSAPPRPCAFTLIVSYEETTFVPMLFQEGRLEEWEPVLLPNGKRGWMRGTDIVPLNLSDVEVRSVKKTLTVRLSPRNDSIQSRTMKFVKPSFLNDFIEITPLEESDKVELWGRVLLIEPGAWSMNGWLPISDIKFGFVQAQRDAASYWAGTHQSVDWHGKEDDKRLAQKILEWMGEEYNTTTFLHPGIFWST